MSRRRGFWRLAQFSAWSACTQMHQQKQISPSCHERKASDQSSKTSWEPAFRESRWFRKGRTLQELLTPSAAEFYSQDCMRLGDKRTLESQIHEVTKIAVSALRGTLPSQFSVEERFSWTVNRRRRTKKTTRYWVYSTSTCRSYTVKRKIMRSSGCGKPLTNI